MRRIVFFLGALLMTIEMSAQNNSLAWVKGIGGSKSEQGNGVVVDKDGNIITVGYFQETVDFDPSSGVHNLTSMGIEDIFIKKSNPNGELIWVQQIGKSGISRASFVSIDHSNHILVSGYFTDTLLDFDSGIGTHNLGSSGYSVFILKLGSNGDFIWAKNYAAFETNSLVVDEKNNVYSSGRFGDTTDFDPGPNQAVLYPSNNMNGYIVKLDSNGNYIWANKFEGNYEMLICNIELDAKNNLYVLGTFRGAVDLDIDTTQFVATSSGGTIATSIFIVKMDSSKKFVWGKNIKGNSLNTGFVLDIDDDFSIYFTGYFNNTIDFDPGPATNNWVSNGGYDAYIVKLDSSGIFQWVRTYGNVSTDIGQDLIVDHNNSILLSTSLEGVVSYDSMGFAKNTHYIGGSDITLFKLNKSGDVINTYHFGNSGNEAIYNMDVNTDNDILCTGSYTEGFNVLGDSIMSHGMSDILLYRIHQWPNSMADYNSNDKFQIYPNPNTGDFTIQGTSNQPYRLEIKSVDGVVRYSNNNWNNSEQIHLTPLPSGIYFLSLTAHGKQFHSQFIKL